MRIASFNVNGIRAALKRGFSDWMETRDCDVIGLQEVRCRPADLPEGAFGDRHVSWAPGSLAGRNGVALLTRTAPAEVRSWGTHLVMTPGETPNLDEVRTGIIDYQLSCFPSLTRGATSRLISPTHPSPSPACTCPREPLRTPRTRSP